MQRVLRRTAQAQKQASRRAAKAKKSEGQAEALRFRESVKEANAEIRTNLRDARRARKEDWELGPLAPKRDLGAYNNYGTFSRSLRQDYTNEGISIQKAHVREQRCAWAGGSKHLNLAVDDRVVILEGPDKGKIDRIKEVFSENGTVTLQSHHKAVFQTWIEGQQVPTAMPISIDAVRLVYPITNPETGVTKDTIINQLRAVAPNMQSDHMTHTRWKHGIKWDRVATGINVVIPWPEVEAPEYVTHDKDTPRDKAEERTFYYNLLSPPLPTPVLDELRNKYSRFRTRHEPEYIAKKEAEAARKKGMQSMLMSMQTPLEEFHAKQRELKAARGEPQLTDDMLEKLGQVIAQAKVSSLENVGVTEVTLESSSKTTPSVS